MEEFIRGVMGCPSRLVCYEIRLSFGVILSSFEINKYTRKEKLEENFLNEEKGHVLDGLEQHFSFLSQST